MAGAAPTPAAPAEPTAPAAAAPAAAPTAPPAVPPEELEHLAGGENLEPEDSEAPASGAKPPVDLVWYRTGNGLEWEVTVGSAAWERLSTDGSVTRIDGPTKP